MSGESELERAVREDFARAARWERRYVVFGVIAAGFLAAACLAFDLYREWWIWNR